MLLPSASDMPMAQQSADRAAKYLIDCFNLGCTTIDHDSLDVDRGCLLHPVHPLNQNRHDFSVGDKKTNRTTFARSFIANNNDKQVAVSRRTKK